MLGQLGAQRQAGAHVDVHHQLDVGDRRARLGHPARDRALGAGELLACAVTGSAPAASRSRRRCRARRAGERLDVGLHDLAAATRRRHRAEVDAQLGRHPPRHRRGQDRVRGRSSARRRAARRPSGSSRAIASPSATVAPRRRGSRASRPPRPRTPLSPCQSRSPPAPRRRPRPRRRCLSQRTIVPSSMESDRRGIRTSVIWATLMTARTRRRARRRRERRRQRRLDHLGSCARPRAHRRRRAAPPSTPASASRSRATTSGSRLRISSSSPGLR